MIATAGHVDHGKSTLVRALTGMEPDRWAEERRRGMTIDLGYAWTDLPSGEPVAFVDVPGHARFIGNMLAGLGPAPAVLFVVAADEGWRQQSSEHLAAVHGLGLTHGLLAVTRSDLADPAPAMAESLARLAVSSLGRVSAVAVSGATGFGLDVLRAELGALVAALPPPTAHARVRLWVDRVFTVRGSGTVVTGTLGGGRLRVGDTLDLRGRPVRVRALQSLGSAYDEVGAVARVAVNLRGVERDDVARGDTLLTPGRWLPTDRIDVALQLADSGCVATDLPRHLVLHVGSAAVAATLRPLGALAARLTLQRSLALQPGDRALLRDPGAQRIVAGAAVLDIDPPELRRRGAAAARGQLLADGPPDAAAEVARRGAVTAAELATLGIALPAPGEVLTVGSWLVDPARWAAWQDRLAQAVDEHARQAPLEGGLADGAGVRLLALPDAALLAPLVDAAGLEQHRGRIRRPGTAPELGPWLAIVQDRLSVDPFAAPEQAELDALGASRQAVAAAVTADRLLLLPGGIALLPDAPALAMRLLAGIAQPFTASEARQALSTTRRVAIPLLEHLDRRGWTRRVDGARREVVR